MKSYMDANKTVFLVKYTNHISSTGYENQVCPEAKRLNYNNIMKDRDLTHTPVYCNQLSV
jgi:hypothetical protein